MYISHSSGVLLIYHVYPAFEVQHQLNWLIDLLLHLYHAVRHMRFFSTKEFNICSFVVWFSSPMNSKFKFITFCNVNILDTAKINDKMNLQWLNSAWGFVKKNSEFLFLTTDAYGYWITLKPTSSIVNISEFVYLAVIDFSERLHDCLHRRMDRKHVGNSL